MKGIKPECDYALFTKDPFNVPQCSIHNPHSCAGCSIVGMAARWNPFKTFFADFWALFDTQLTDEELAEIQEAWKRLSVVNKEFPGVKP